MSWWKKMLGLASKEPELDESWEHFDFVSGQRPPGRVALQPRAAVELSPQTIPGFSLVGAFDGERQGEITLLADGRSESLEFETFPYFRAALVPNVADGKGHAELWPRVKPHLESLYQAALERLAPDEESGGRARRSVLARLTQLKGEDRLDQRDRDTLERLERLPLLDDECANEAESGKLTLKDLSQATVVCLEAAEIWGRVPPLSHRPGVYFVEDSDDFAMLRMYYDLSWKPELVEQQMKLYGQEFVTLAERDLALRLDLEGGTRESEHCFHFPVEGHPPLKLDLAAGTVSGPTAKGEIVRLDFDALTRFDVEHRKRYNDTTVDDEYDLLLSDGKGQLVFSERCRNGEGEEVLSILCSLAGAMGFQRPLLASWPHSTRPLQDLVHAYNRSSPVHESARVWWESLMNGNAPVGLTWLAAAGFIRITTNPRILGHTLPAKKASSHVRSWLAGRS